LLRPPQEHLEWPSERLEPPPPSTGVFHLAADRWQIAASLADGRIVLWARSDVLGDPNIPKVVSFVAPRRHGYRLVLTSDLGGGGGAEFPESGLVVGGFFEQKVFAWCRANGDLVGQPISLEAGVYSLAKTEGRVRLIIPYLLTTEWPD